MIIPSIKEEGRIGSGNWNAFPHDRISEVYRAAEKWSAELRNIEKPWLCWCLSNKWCILQQKLIKYVGWTPVVGNDILVGQPTVLQGSIYIDFNQGLNLPRLHRCFPLEWIYLFVEKLAFWHSDLLLSKKDMEKAARCFDDLRQGEIAIDWVGSGIPFIQFARNILPVGNRNRLFEVLGCNTRLASRQQFNDGLGFWRHPEKHPNNTQLPSDYPHWEHSIGITLWIKNNKHQHKAIGVDTKKGHANSWSINKIKRMELSKQELLDDYEDILYYAKKMGIEDLLD